MIAQWNKTHLKGLYEVAFSDPVTGEELASVTVMGERLLAWLTLKFWISRYA
jgi:hypothetical protein